MKKEVSQMDYDEVRKRTKELLKKNLRIDWIKEKTEKLIMNQEYHPTEYGITSEQYQIILDTYVSSQAGQYLIKESIEFFGFSIDEEKYREWLTVYDDILDTILSTADDYINDTIDNDYIQYTFFVDDGFYLSALFDFDYIPEEVKKKCITSVDASISTSLGEYASLWRTKKDTMLYIHSFYDYDNKQVLYYTYEFLNLDHLFEFIEDNGEYINPDIIIYNDDNINNLFMTVYNILSQDITLIGTAQHKTADIPLDILIQEGLIS